jgi:hypothetical protein
MPTTIDSAGITFNDATSLTSAVLAANSVGATQIANGSVTAAKLGTTEQTQIAKAWVNFDGTLATPITPRASYNVSSVTKNGTGDYTVNFASALADANYSVSGVCASGALITYAGGGAPYVCGPQATPTTSQFRFGTGWGTVGGSSGARQDQSYIYIQVFGN